jgi:hypothetical protein
VISTYVCKSECSKICCIKMFFFFENLIWTHSAKYFRPKIVPFVCQ